MSEKTNTKDLSLNQNEDAMKLKLSSLKRKLEKIELGGGEQKIKKHNEKGKLTARERIALLLDVKRTDFKGFFYYYDQFFFRLIQVLIIINNTFKKSNI